MESIIAARPQVLGEEAIICLSNPSAAVNMAVTNGNGTWNCIPFAASVAIPLPSSNNCYSGSTPPPIAAQGVAIPFPSSTNRYTGSTPPPMAAQFPSFESIGTQITPPMCYSAPRQAENTNMSQQALEMQGDMSLKSPQDSLSSLSAATEDDGVNSSFEEGEESSSAQQRMEEGSEMQQEMIDGSISECCSVYETDEDTYPPTDEFETPPESIADDASIVRRSPRSTRGTRRTRQNYNPQDDFRRFSARSKKKTSFFGISHQAEGRRRRGGPKNHRPMASKRALKFDKKKDLLLVNKVPLSATKSTFVPPPASPASPQAQATTPVEKQSEEPQEPSPEAKEDPGEVEDTTPAEEEPLSLSEVHKMFPVGRMVWAKLPTWCWWPGYVYSHGGEATRKEQEKLLDPEELEEDEHKLWVSWYGEKQLSRISHEKMVPFDDFKGWFSPLEMKGMYRKAVFLALKTAAERCKIKFTANESDKQNHWVVTESCPTPTRITSKPQLPLHQATDTTPGKEAETPAGKLTPSGKAGEESPSSKQGEESPSEGGEEESANSATKNKMSKQRGRKGHRGRQKGDIYLTDYEHEMIEWALNGFLPMGPEGLWPTEEEQQDRFMVVAADTVDPESNGDLTYDFPAPPKKKFAALMKQQKESFEKVRSGSLKINDICIGCGAQETCTIHPLFEGGYCRKCTDNFLQCSYSFDEDGSQIGCCICSGGEFGDRQTVYICDNQNCPKVYCGQCIEKLCGPEEHQRVIDAENWKCYMCCPEYSKVGLLVKRDDWDYNLRRLFLVDYNNEYPPMPVHRPIPPDERRPLRVLGLFDGIATGNLVLKELGFEISKYVSSEVDPDAINVSRVRHVEIQHVGDVEDISAQDLERWGPFDLVYGGSPCNDLSIVNPARKGIFEGTGRLFFDFYRILMLTKPSPGDNRPFFWLYENVVSMRGHDKRVISRFLQCNPVVVDAKDISPTHRARYFWGNIPGMNRPATPLPGDRLYLQECLEENCERYAQFTKLRTITTKMNSIKQGKKAKMPVRVGATEEDVLWCTEMERLFGFPDHYTDVNNMGRSGRQKLLGKSWSVPVVRHILSPLKDYFKSNTNRNATPPSVGVAPEQGEKMGQEENKVTPSDSKTATIEKVTPRLEKAPTEDVEDPLEDMPPAKKVCTDKDQKPGPPE